MPKRPANGLLAWEATIGYLRLQYGLEARLTLQAVTDTNVTVWSAYAVWGQNTEQVTDKPTIVDALRDLWSLVDRKHVIFESREAMLRRPVNYDESEWFDRPTQTVFDQMIELVHIAFSGAWTLTIIYEPVEIADVRFQTRLIAEPNNLNLIGQGGTLAEACRDLLRVIAQVHIQRRIRQSSGASG
jgi:hypothetical protein